MNNEPVYIVDDDSDDRDFIQDAWKDLKYNNRLIFFKNAEEVLQHLITEGTVPFLVLCDVNLPKMDGFKLKEKLLKHSATRYKSIPFIFWSSNISNAQIQQAYDLGINGFFIKESSFEALKETLSDIVSYWAKSKVPE